MPIDVGSAAPEFSLPDASGAHVTLSAFRGRWIVLYFYPKDDTAGCTMEACNFRDLSAELSAAGVAVLGISPDDRASHEKFARKTALNFPILSDARNGDGAPTVALAYGVWVQKSLYGRKYMGVERTTFIIDPSGRVARRWDRVRVPGHAKLVAAAAIEMAGGAVPNAAG